MVGNAQNLQLYLFPVGAAGHGPQHPEYLQPPRSPSRPVGGCRHGGVRADSLPDRLFHAGAGRRRQPGRAGLAPDTSPMVLGLWPKSPKAGGKGLHGSCLLATISVCPPRVLKPARRVGQNAKPFGGKARLQ